MDAQCLSTLSGLSRRRGRARRIQRQVHGQSDGPARIVARNAPWPCARQLPQLLSSPGALAVQRAATCRIPLTRAQHATDQVMTALARNLTSVVEARPETADA